MEYFTSVKIPYTKNKFYIFYKLISNDQHFITRITIPDYDDKVICLLKHFPYTDIVKNILFLLKINTLKEDYIIKTVTRTIEMDIEEQENLLNPDNNSNNYDSDDYNYTDYYEGNETD